MKVLPESYRRLLTPKQRREIGQPTIAESKAQGEVRIEKDLQRLIYLELTRRNLFFHYSRMDKRTGSMVGTPDFALPLNGKYVAIECKTEMGKTTFEQNKVAAQIDNQLGYYYVVRNFSQFINILERHRNL